MDHSYLDALAFYGIEGAHPGGFNLTTSILMNEKIDQPTKILDAGCGIGQTSEFLAQTFHCQVYAVDNHPEMVNKAINRFQQNNLPIHVYMSSIEELPFADNFFDFIIAESTTGFTDIQKSIGEYHRVLNPGGILLSIDMTAETTLNLYQKKELMTFYNLKNIPTQSEWVSAFNQHGFKNLSILQSSSVLDELKNYSTANQRSNSSIPFNGSLNEVIKEHYRLLLTYGNSLGFRVFRAIKEYSS